MSGDDMSEKILYELPVESPEETARIAGYRAFGALLHGGYLAEIGVDSWEIHTPGRGTLPWDPPGPYQAEWRRGVREAYRVYPYIVPEIAERGYGTRLMIVRLCSPRAFSWA